MSENFQEKDAGEQFEKIIDWNKVKKDFKKTVCVIMVCIACLAGFITYNTVQENKLKNAVTANNTITSLQQKIQSAYTTFPYR
ncbi:hypothetical protein CLV32_4676 [Pedobacter duraquae]|uniref:Uncharacterized protein n=1 Tax=Pedobacter duraquae TaxID=425511 RepID=A0A4R6IB81_9SPHI|nr:hypothetical protein CLV32_4676 [Pedobacter duraquae]